MTTYQYLTAEQWGGTWTRPPVHEEPLDPEGYLHHTAGNPYSDWLAADAFRQLNKIAQEGKGYSFLDYDAMVHLDKARDIVTIGEGRGEWLSAATRDRNELGEAVVVFGYFHPPTSDPNHYSHRYTERPDPRHIEGAALAFDWLRRRGLVAPDFKLLGHRENPAHPNATGCPGDYWYDVPVGQTRSAIQQVRDRVAQLQTPTVEDDMELVTLPFWRLDTRGTGANFDAYKLNANTEHTVSIPGVSGCRLAQVTFTPVLPEADGHFAVWNGVGPKPFTSFANVQAGDAPDGRTLLVLLNGGSFKFHTTVRTHMLVDFTGIAFR